MSFSMNMLDVGLGLLLIFFALTGMLHGFVDELSGLAGIVLGILFTANPAIHGLAIGFLSPYFSSNEWINLLAYISVFALVFIMAKLIGAMLIKLLAREGNSWFNNLLGLFTGTVKGFIACTLVLICLYHIWPNTGIRKNSLLTSYINEVWQYIAQLSDGLYSLPVFIPPAL